MLNSNKYKDMNHYQSEDGRFTILIYDIEADARRLEAQGGSLLFCTTDEETDAEIERLLQEHQNENLINTSI